MQEAANEIRPSTSFWTFFWFSIWTGIAVACIYFCQPLLHAIGQDLRLSDREASFVATATQIGYGAGIFTLVPLGDFLPRRRLVFTKLALLAGATLGCALAPTLGLLAVASFFVGVFATTAQDLVPIAAELAPPDKRGRYVGYVMSGLMLGILLSRTVAGSIAGMWGWRAVFVVGSGAVLASLGTTLAFFPPLPTVARKGSLAAVYRSMVVLVRVHPALRLAIMRHGLLGLSFSAFWTTLAFFLSGPPFGWSSAKIGLVGLAGAAGVLASSVAGRLADDRGPLFAIRGATVLAFASFVAMGIFSSSTIVLLVFTVLFDVAVQSSLVSHQSIVYALDPTARARINGLFVSSLFLFFSLGSFLSALVWSWAGWRGVMGCSAITSALAFVLTLGGAGSGAAADRVHVRERD